MKQMQQKSSNINMKIAYTAKVVTDPENGAYTAKVVTDPENGDSLLEFSPDMIKDLDWRQGDMVNWKQVKKQFFIENISWLSRQEKELPLFIVQTLISHKASFAVRAESLEHAFDAVTMEEVTEFDKKYIGSNIIGGRQITLDEYLAECPKKLTPKQKSKKIHKITY